MADFIEQELSLGEITGRQGDGTTIDYRHSGQAGRSQKHGAYQGNEPYPPHGKPPECTMPPFCPGLHHYASRLHSAGIAHAICGIDESLHGICQRHPGA